MKFPDFGVISLPAQAATTIVDACLIDDALVLNAQLRRGAAARLLRMRRAQTERRARDDESHRQRMTQTQVEMETRVAAAEREAIAGALRWQIEEARLEAAVASRVAQRVADCAADAFVTFAKAESRAELLARRVRDAIAASSGDALPVLTVHSTQLALLEEQLGDSLCRFATDDTTPPARAILDSPFVRIVIDLNRHADLLAAHLRSPRPMDERMADPMPHSGIEIVPVADPDGDAAQEARDPDMDEAQ